MAETQASMETNALELATSSNEKLEATNKAAMEAEGAANATRSEEHKAAFDASTLDAAPAHIRATLVEAKDKSLKRADEYMTALKEQPAERIQTAWFVTLFLTLVMVIAAIAAAVNLDEDRTNGSHGAAFAAVWSMLMLLVLAAGGTFVLRKIRTNLTVGLLLGFTAMLAQQFFVLFAVFAGLADDSRGKRNTDQVMSAFSFLVWLALSAFGLVIYFDRGHLLTGATFAEDAATNPTTSAEPV